MKKLKFSSITICVLCMICLTGPSAGEDENSAASPMKSTEKEALYSAIQGFVGKSWNGSDLYPDPCGWTPIQGVSCDQINGYWYVTELSIGPVLDNSLTCNENVEFNSHLFSLRHLKSLSFFNCFQSKEHPVSIPTEKWELLGDTLESLEFRLNPGLGGQIPSAFGELKNLNSLVLMENGLTGELPENIGYLANLKRLNLASNSISGVIPASYGQMKELLILDLSRNTISGELPSAFGGMTSLLKLDLSNNQLVGTIPEMFANLKNLTLLDLSNNRLSGGLSKTVEELSSLEELILSNNPTGGEIMNLQWRKLMSLTALDLSNMSLTGSIPDSIADLKALRFLGFSDNNLIGSIPEKLGTLPNISAIYIHGNNLTGELKFSEWFYSKLGRRFGAWGNANLCLSPSTIPQNYAPFGVKRCTEDIIKSESHLEAHMDQPSSQSSQAQSIHGIYASFVILPLCIITLIFSL